MIRVLLADGRALFRSAIAELLTAETEVVVVGEADTAATAVRLAGEARPDVAALDAGLPGGAVAAAKAMRGCQPDLHIVLYGLTTDRQIFADAVHAGVTGFLDRGSDAAYLAAMVARVAAGELVVAPSLTQLFAISEDRPSGATAVGGRGRAAVLTPEEREVLQLVAAGDSNRTVAIALGLSEHTVRGRLRSISRKLGAQNRLQAVSKALHAGEIGRSEDNGASQGTVEAQSPADA